GSVVVVGAVRVGVVAVVLRGLVGGGRVGLVVVAAGGQSADGQQGGGGGGGQAGGVGDGVGHCWPPGTVMVTRRFLALPASVSLEAMGSLSPLPSVVTSTPFGRRALISLATESARRSESFWL